jgi:HSP20 family molecular chaperone IbpA
MAEKTVAEAQVPARIEKEQPLATRELERYLTPAVDIYETADGIAVVADVPGVEKDGLDINVDNQILTIRGTVSRELRANPTWREFDLVNYYRQFTLGEAVDVEKISAELRHGVLTLHLPKAERAKPKQIPVSVS